MSLQQYESMPLYIIGEVTRDTEVQIRRAIGSPAALRIEEEIVEMDSINFYQHHHFDRGMNTPENRGEGVGLTHPQSVSNNRHLEGNTIHQLIENSELNQNQEKVTHANTEHFIVETVQGVYTIEPQDNGTYRILSKGEKVGVVYAEAAQDEGVQWRTMDDIDDKFVAAIGEGITAHNNLNIEK